MALSKAAISGVPAPRTVHFEGILKGIPVNILLDSGSTSFFLSASVAEQLSTKKFIAMPTNVQVAGGGVFSSSGSLHHVNWSVQEIPFVSNFRILPLQAYDVILGMDWLEIHSPMQVHWEKKWV